MLKKYLNYAWRIALALASVAVLVVSVKVLAQLYDYKKGVDGNPYLYPRVAEGVRAVRMNDHTSRLYRPESGKYLTPRYAWICGSVAEGDSLIVFAPRGNEYRGFLNARTGDVVIPAKYDRAWTFSEGSALVVDNGRLACIGPDGEVRFRMPGLFPKKNVVLLDLVYHRGLAPVPDSTGRYGLIDTAGNWVVEPAYTEIWPPHGEGWRVVRSGKRYGLMAPDLSLSLPLEYASVDYAEDGKSVYVYQDGLCKRLTFTGDVINHFVVESTSSLYYESYDSELGETLSVLSDKFLKFEVGSKCGVISLIDGSVLLPACYTEVNLVSPSMIVASLEPGEQLFFDSRGHIIEKTGR